MEILDEKGRLFGVVNVIDALAVLLVLAVVAAGAALVLGSEPEPEPEFASTHATLDLGTQPDYIVAQLNEGDTYLNQGESPAVHGGRESDTPRHKPRSTLIQGYPL